MKKWMIVMLLAALLVFGGVFGFYFFKQSMMASYFASMPVPTVPITAVTVKAQSWTPQIKAIGFIEPENGVMLSAAESGVVNKISFNAADKVEQGAVLVQLDNAKELADLQSAESRRAALKSDRDRLAKLAKESLGTRSQADTAAADYASLLAQIESLKATIARREIRAPFAGITGILQVQLGQYVQAGTEIVRLENTDTMKIRFSLGEENYSHLALNMPVKIAVSAYPDKTFSGHITAIEPAIDMKSGVVKLEAVIPNSDQLLRSGMYAEVAVQQAAMLEQVVIPQRAIDFTLYGESVYLIEQVQPEDKTQAAYDVVKQKTVTVAERRGSDALIAKGVVVGDRVVTSGQLKLANGSHVKIVEDDTLLPPATLPRD